MSWRRALRPLLLFGLADRRLDGLVSGAVVALLALSRFTLLASGPWEWDETLFARGILDFDMAAHFPHPPGFPGWLAIGHLLLPLAGEPLSALQWASAAFSVLALWPLVALGRRVAQPPVAVACALLVLAAPGPWLFAVRGFSSTAAGVLALAAAALLVGGGVAGRRITVFTVLMAGAFLVRPILLPPLAVLWLGVACTVRPRRRLLPGVGVAAAMGGVSLLAMVWAEGGWQAFTAAFLRHGSRHFSRLVDNPGGFVELGLVKGLGGGWWGGVVMVVCGLGLVVWWRRVGARSALLWLVVLSVAVAQLLWLQNRSYGRYAVPVQMAAAPLLAAGAGLLPPVAATAGLAVAVGVMGWRSLPLLVEQHERLLPAWAAVQHAAEKAGSLDVSVVVEPELHPFASYHWHLLQRAGVAVPPLLLSPWAPEAWQGVAGDYLVATVHPQLYLPSLTAEEWRWSGVSRRLEPLTQQRFLDAQLSRSPPLPLGRWWAVESAADGDEFMWAAPDAALLLPPLPGHSAVVLDLRPAAGDAPLIVVVNGDELASIAGDGERLQLRLPAAWLNDRQPNHVKLGRSALPAAAHPADPRQLSVQLFGVSMVRPGAAWAIPELSEGALAMAGVELQGAYGSELFPEYGRGMWLAPQASLRVPRGRGELFLRLWAPRPSAPQTRARVAAATLPLPVDAGRAPQEWVLQLAASHGGDELTEVALESRPYCPALAGDSDDARQLGVVLLGVRFVPAAAGEALDGAGADP